MVVLTWLDFLVIGCFFVVLFSIAGYYARRAGKDTQTFFLSGRNLHWFLAGTAMVATTFAADTPLAVTELVAKNGIAGNWLWWNMAIGSTLTVFFFARLWRRAGIMTDVEFIEFRYSGKAAAALRGIRAVYLGLLMNAVVMGWVHKAMEKIFRVTVHGVDPFLLVMGAAVIVGLYATASGLLGSVRVDSFQFIFAMSGCILLAVIVVRLPEVGGLAAMKGKLAPEVLAFVPRIGTSVIQGITGGVLSLSLGAFLAYIGLQWWSSWYPGAEPGGGGYVAQRMMSAKNEKHSLFATLWFTIAHYTIRPWPWILVALSALILLPRSTDSEALKKENPVLWEQVSKVYDNGNFDPSGNPSHADPEFRAFYEKYENTVDPGVLFPKLMVRYLPAGLVGLLIAVFLAAYMSTISSQLNWGTSYLINDFYRRFIRKEAPERHYVLASRIGIVLMTAFSLVVTRYFLTTISGAWVFMINASAGIGMVLILRWFWWRVNAWSEIAAMAAPLVIYPISRLLFHLEPPLTLYPVVVGTTLVWLIVTFLTRPTDQSTLKAFYTKVHPGGSGWKPVRQECPGVVADEGMGRLFVNWVCGIVLIYSFLFGAGSLLFGRIVLGSVLLAVGILAAGVIVLNLKKHSVL